MFEFAATSTRVVSMLGVVIRAVRPFLSIASTSALFRISSLATDAIPAPAILISCVVPFFVVLEKRNVDCGQVVEP